MCAVHTSRTEVEALSALIARVNSSLDTAEVLDQATEVCIALVGCAGALVYLWDEEQERLVIRGASEGYRHWIGVFTLALGEGLTGWTALSRKAGRITDDPLSDPRYKLVPELEDTRFQSVLTIPVVGREDQLVGVLTLHTTAPHEFSDDDVRLLETVASLVAGAVENARLHEQAIRTMKVFRSLADVGRQMTTASHAPETLQRLALTALELLDAALVVVLRLDEGRGMLAVETWVGGGSGPVRADAVRVDERWSRLLGAGPTTITVGPEDSLAGQFGLTAEPHSLFAAPLVFEGSPTGLLCCYALEQRVLGDDSLALLGTIANHLTIALEEGRLGSSAAERSTVRELFDALRAGEPSSIRLAAQIGVDLELPHVILMAEAIDHASAGLTGAVAAAVRTAFPGGLVDTRPRMLAGLLPVRDADQRTLADRLGESVPAGFVAGFSDVVRVPTEYSLAFRQARMACAVAHTSSHGRPVRDYGSLGAQRHLWLISQERDPDPLEQAIARLLDLDRAHGSQLFRTLETYLENRGNAGQTAAALYVHRNTLRQRLRRIAGIIDVDPSDPAAWFDLVLAVRLIRFRGIGEENPERGG